MTIPCIIGYCWLMTVHYGHPLQTLTTGIYGSRVNCEATAHYVMHPSARSIARWGQMYPFPAYVECHDAYEKSAVNCEPDQSGKLTNCWYGPPPARPCDWKKIVCTTPYDLSGYGY
jgi:hypothetical protein